MVSTSNQLISFKFHTFTQLCDHILGESIPSISNTGVNTSFNTSNIPVSYSNCKFYILSKIQFFIFYPKLIYFSNLIFIVFISSLDVLPNLNHVIYRNNDCNELYLTSSNSNINNTIGNVFLKFIFLLIIFSFKIILNVFHVIVSLI